MDEDVPHTDGDGQETSVYVIASAPTPEQFEGTVSPEFYSDPATRTIVEPTLEWMEVEGVEDALRRSSLKPWAIYRGTENWLHSVPVPLNREGLVPTKRRFFARAKFTKIRTRGS